MDALLLTATNQRRIRFVMERSIYNTPLLRGLFRLMGVIPVSSEDGKKELLEFMKQARAALDDGYLVCIFAEGATDPQRHAARVPRRLRAHRQGHRTIPIIPVYIGGAWGSILSYAHGRLLAAAAGLLPLSR